MTSAVANGHAAGVRDCLAKIDVVLETLLERIRECGLQYEKASTLGEQAAAIGALSRLAIQRRTIEDLRVGIPAAIEHGDAYVLARIIHP